MLQFGVPQGSVLGPRIFIQYAEDVAELFSQHGLHRHLFADDMQGHCSGRPIDCPLMVKRLERCITDVSAWCASKRLQLNGDNTELLWFGSTTHLRQVSPTRSITVNNNVIQPAAAVRDLGEWIESELSIRDHVSRVAQTCFFHLRRLQSVRRQLGCDVSARLVSDLVLSHLDYCNAVLAGLPASTLAPLQSPACSSETCTRPEAARPCNSRPPRVALVTRGAAFRVQTVSTGIQSPHRSYTRLHH